MVTDQDFDGFERLSETHYPAVAGQAPLRINYRYSTRGGGALFDIINGDTDERIWQADNPEIGIDAAGKILLRNPENKKKVVTDLLAEWFIQ